jgi:DNA-binding NtrC family response regulator
MASTHVLVIDDEPAIRQILATVLKRAGYFADTAAGFGEATAKLSRGDVDVALCDITMPDGNGMDLLRQSRSAGLETVFVMVTAMSSVETAVEALRAGAFDYLIKPVRNEELLHRIAQIESLRGLREENKVLRNAVRENAVRVFRFHSPGMLQVEHLAGKVAPTNSTVLIVGESGTGKGVLANAIHQMSPRAEQPFVSVNCSAIPENLMESEFFGHTKGAFTGAEKARKGLFLQADKGTLFLDEIGELPLPMQTKLLHAIEDKQVRAVGAEQMRQVDTRIVAATNRDLHEMVEKGLFREDLFFRLSMFQITIPPLRERQPDIRALIRFLLESGRESGGSTIELDPEAEACLLAYAWPGNVRELENVINRARILADSDCVSVAELPARLVAAVRHVLAAPPESGHELGLREQMQKVEHDIILRAIASADGDRRVAANRLGISLSSLYRKLEDHGPQSIDRGQPHPAET